MASAPESFVRPLAGVGARYTNQGKYPYLDFHSVIGTTIFNRRRPMAFSLMTTRVGIFLIPRPPAGSTRIRHTSPLTGFGFVVIQFFLAERLEAGQFLVGAVIRLRQFRRRGEDGLSLLTRHPPQLGWCQAFYAFNHFDGPGARSLPGATFFLQLRRHLRSNRLHADFNAGPFR